MKFNLLEKIIMLTKHSLKGFVVQLILINTIIAADMNAQQIKKVNDVYIDINLSNASIEDIFKVIEDKTDFKFSYNSEDLDGKIRMSNTAKEVAVRDILLEISEKGNVKFRQVNSNITVQKLKKKDKKSPKIEIFIQGVKVTGTITDSENNAIPGVNVFEKGTTSGTITDIDGNYAIEVPGAESIIVFSSVGYLTEELVVGNRSQIDLSLTEDITQLSEIVVTAFGLERDKKSVTYAAQNVSAEEISEARPLSIAEGLSGKVAGLSVTRVGGIPGSDPKVILRGNRSIAGSSQPLYVVDGVTIGGNINNISPDDIESITVLKGANAAALYGSRANNGVIVITTKSGKGTEGFSVDFNTSYMASRANHLNNWQNEYGQGTDGIYSERSNKSWGPKMDGSQVPHWSNDPNWPTPTTSYTAQPNNKTTDFFQTGQNLATNIGVSSKGEHSVSYISYTFTDAKGIIPKNELQRHNLSARVTSSFFDKLTIDTKINVIREQMDNRPATGGGYENPVRALYKMPPNIKSADAQMYQYTDPEGLVKQHFWLPNINAPSNPYWAVNNVNRNNLQDRILAMMSIDYDITEHLNFRVRTSLDASSSTNETKYNNDFYIVADDGRYNKQSQRTHEWNTDAFLNYNRDFGQDWSVDVTVGGNIRKNEFSRTRVGIGRDSPLNVPNLFAIGNFSIITADEQFRQREVQSVFGFATIGWKNAIFLDVTARNDWSSTLSPANWSFFYPSVGLSVVASDLVTLPDWWTFAKVRGNWAQVGNDTNPYQVSRAADIRGGGRGGFLQLSTTVPAANLLPEQTTAIELGFDLRFFENRLGLDFLWYKSNSTDQLFRQSIPTPSGASNVFINGADIQNDGIELTFTASPIKSRDFNWDLFFNFGANNSTVVKLAAGLDQLNVGSASFLRQFRLIAGEPWGDVYSRGFERDDQGRVIVETDGTPRTTSGLDVQVANFNPDWLGGFGNSFTWRNLSLSFLIDIRQGGTIVSNTNAIMFADGVTEETLIGRDGNMVFGGNFFGGETAVQADGSPNTVATNAEIMWNKLGGRNAPVGEAFVLDASNSRLRELIIGYSFPTSSLSNTPFTHVKVSFVGRNLFFITNAAGNVDSELIVSTATNADGFESFGLPPVREFGINLKFGF